MSSVHKDEYSTSSNTGSEYSRLNPLGWFRRSQDSVDGTGGAPVEVRPINHTECEVSSCLGRPYKLGCLYNMSTGEVMTSFSLWSQTTLRKVVKEGRTRTESKVLLDDDLTEKMAVLDVPHHEKLGIVSGRIRPSGAGQFVTDRVKSCTTSRATLVHKRISSYESLSSEHLCNVEYPEIIAKGFTHVVIGIEYGAQVFLVVEKKSNNETAASNDRQKLEILINEFGRTSERKSAKKFDDDFIRSLKFRFIGDGVDVPILSSFTEALETYTKIPSMTHDKNVPIKAWLYPINNLSLQQPRYFYSFTDVVYVGPRAVHLILERYEELRMFNMRVTDMKKSLAYSKIKNLKYHVDEFGKCISCVLQTFTTDLYETLPDVSAGSDKEQKLLRWMVESNQPPFELDQIDHWLRQQEAVVGSISNNLKKLENIPNVKQEFYSGASQAEIFDPEYNFIVMLKLSVRRQNIQIDAMKKALKNMYKSAEVEDVMPYQPELFKLNNLSQFIDMAKSNVDNNGISFIITDEVDELETESSSEINVYHNGNFLYKDFKPPSKPGPPKQVDINYNMITIEWAEPEIGKDSIASYIVKGTSKNGKSKVEIQCNSACTTLQDLVPDTEYTFCVQSQYDFGLGCQSRFSEPMCTLLTSAPINPVVHQTSPKHCMLRWSEPKILSKLIYRTDLVYRIQVYQNGIIIEERDGSCITSCSLRVETGWEYSFRIAAIAKGSVSKYSEFSRKIFMASLGEIAKRSNATIKLITEGDPSILQLIPDSVYRDEVNKLEKMAIGDPHDLAPNKTILLVGATGTGKTTLINAIVNHVMGIEWDFAVRYLLIKDQPKANQARSQTRWVTAYTLYHQSDFRVPFSLTIVDTPGYGDTGGIAYDKQITKQLEHFFKGKGKDGIDSLDAVGFVIPAANIRLTPTQKYIFDSILSLFGSDIADRIFPMVTFATDQRPLILDGLNEARLPYKMHFKFDNYAVYRRNIGKDCMSAKLSWQMGNEGYKKFFEHILTITSTSLTLTNEVLEERRSLEAQVSGIQLHIREGLILMDELDTTVQILKDHEAEIVRNENFHFIVKVPKINKIDLEVGRYVTNCLTCNRTCHYPCVYSRDEDKSRCAAMNRQTGNCKVCQLKCIWSVHVNTPFRIEIEEIEEERSFEKLREKYQKATEEKLTGDQLIDKIIDQIDDEKLKVAEMTNEARKSLVRLSQIALRPTAMTTIDYIDIIIESEKFESKRGWQSRINQLKEVRDQVSTIDMIASGKNLANFEVEYGSNAKTGDDKWSAAKDYVKKTGRSFGRKMLNFFKSSLSQEPTPDVSSGMNLKINADVVASGSQTVCEGQEQQNATAANDVIDFNDKVNTVEQKNVNEQAGDDQVKAKSTELLDQTTDDSTSEEEDSEYETDPGSEAEKDDAQNDQVNTAAQINAQEQAQVDQAEPKLTESSDLATNIPGKDETESGSDAEEDVS